MQRLILLFLLMLLLGACGLKGPLYKPSSYTAGLIFTTPMIYEHIS